MIGASCSATAIPKKGLDRRATKGTPAGLSSKDRIRLRIHLGVRGL
jgi:hypothetical protein